MDWGSTGDFLWHFLIIFAWIAYLLVLFQILGDLFRRDHKTSGWVKAIWVALLILFPWITALIYLIARGKGMAERAQDAAAGAKQEADDYIRQAAGRSPAQEIAGRQGAFGSRDHHPSRVRIAEGQIAQLATQNGRQDGFDQAEGALLDISQTRASETLCRTTECRLDAPFGDRCRSSGTRAVTPLVRRVHAARGRRVG